MFTQKVIPIATEEESGTSTGGNAMRRRISPSLTIDGSMTDTESTKKRNNRMPINRKTLKSDVWFAVRRRWAKTSQSTPKYASGFTSDQAYPSAASVYFALKSAAPTTRRTRR